MQFSIRLSKAILSFASAFFAAALSLASNVTTRPVDTLICAGTQIQVPYSVTGTFVSGNIFTVQLSDSAGSFTSPLNLSTLISQVSDTINTVFPGTTTYSAHYRIRVVSSDSSAAWTDNGSNISIFPPPSVSAVASDSSICLGSYVYLSSAGAYLYSWAGGFTDSSWFMPLATATYTLTGTDTNRCSSISSVSITVDTMALKASVLRNTTSSDSSNGKAKVISLGGTSPYSYRWSSFSDSLASESNLSIGSYTVTVTDNTGCTNTASLSISPPLQLTLLSTVNDSGYSRHDGAACLSASGGTVPYTFYWLPGGRSDSSANNLASGNYSVKVIDFIGGRDSVNFTITRPAFLTAHAASQVNASGYGLDDGSAVISVSGGVMPYLYAWSGSASADTLAKDSTLTSGSYTVTVTDAYANTTSTSFSITQPTLLTATISSFENVSCPGGTNAQATVLAHGGVTPYTYSWAPSGELKATATSLNAATYTVTVTDAHRNNATTTVHLVAIDTQKPKITAPPPLTVYATTIGCYAKNVSLGTPLTSDNCSVSSVVNNAADSLPVGTYTIVWTVSDESGNTATASQQLTVKEALAPALSSISGSADVYCQTSGLIYSITNVPGAFSYSWSVPSGFTILSGQGSRSITTNAGSISPGNLTVTVTTACHVPSRTLDIKQQALSKPGTITGSKAVYCGTSAVSYSIRPISGASSYTWTLPSGATLSSGQGTDAIVVDYSSFTPGNISVTAGNSCENSPPGTLAISYAILSAPSLIRGQDEGLSASSGNVKYYVNQEPGITNTWTLPVTGVTKISESENTDTLYLSFSSAFNTGTLSVKSSNGCSTSRETSLFLTKTSGEKIRNPAPGSSTNSGPSNYLFEIKDLYPNPTATGFYNLKINASENAAVLISVYGPLGNLILKSTQILIKGENLIPGELSVPAGLYLLNLRDSNNNLSFSRSLIVQ